MLDDPIKTGLDQVLGGMNITYGRGFALFPNGDVSD